MLFIVFLSSWENGIKAKLGNSINPWELTCLRAWEVQTASGYFQCIQDCGVPEQTGYSRDSRYILRKRHNFYNCRDESCLNIPNIILKACGEVFGILRTFSWVPKTSKLFIGIFKVF